MSGGRVGIRKSDFVCTCGSEGRARHRLRCTDLANPHLRRIDCHSHAPQASCALGQAPAAASAEVTYDCNDGLSNAASWGVKQRAPPRPLEEGLGRATSSECGGRSRYPSISVETRRRRRGQAKGVSIANSLASGGGRGRARARTCGRAGGARARTACESGRARRRGHRAPSCRATRPQARPVPGSAEGSLAAVPVLVWGGPSAATAGARPARARRRRAPCGARALPGCRAQPPRGPLRSRAAGCGGGGSRHRGALAWSRCSCKQPGTP